MNFIRHRKKYFWFSGILAVASIVCLSIWGLNFGIDFKGGSLLEVEYGAERPSHKEIRDALAPLSLKDLNIQSAGEIGILMRFGEVDEQTHQDIIFKLKELGKAPGGEEAAMRVEGEGGIDLGGIVATTESGKVIGGIQKAEFKEIRFESIGPSMGKELKQKAVYATVIAAVMIILYIAWAFRKVSKPVASWKFGLVAIITLCHDLIITLGIFSILGRFFGVEIGGVFVAAILTIFGYSVNDTIIVFDRIREHLIRGTRETFEENIDHSLNETVVRSINTSLTTLLVLLALFFFGGVTIKSFVLALIIGIAFGTYSSIFIASPLLVVWERVRRS